MARLHLPLLHHPMTRAELLVLTIISKHKHLAMLVKLLTAKIILILHFLTNNFDQRHTNTTRLSRFPIINLSIADLHLPPIRYRHHTCSQRFLKHQHRTHNLITARTAHPPSYRSTRLPSTLPIYTRMVHLGPRQHLHPHPLLLRLHVLAQAGPRMHRLLLPTTRQYHRHRHQLHTPTRRAQSALRCPALAPRPMLLALRRLLLLRRMGTRLQLRPWLTPLLRPLCSHRGLGEETLMCLPSVVLELVAVAAGEELLVVVYHLIILLKAHIRNLRHNNNIEHREIVGSSSTFFLRWTTSFFFTCARFFLSFRCTRAQ